MCGNGLGAVSGAGSEVRALRVDEEERGGSLGFGYTREGDGRRAEVDGQVVRR